MRSSRQFSFLKVSNKLVSVRMYRSTFTSLVRSPHIYCWFVVFCDFCALLHAQKHSQAKIN